MSRIRSLVFALSALLIAVALPARAEDSPGFEEIEPVTYDAMFVDAVQAHHAGRKGEAFAKFMRLACGGDKAAQEQVGMMYMVGEGAYKNTGMAYLWLKTAAEFNFAPYRTMTKKIESVMTPEQAKHFAELAAGMIAQYGQRATNVTCNAQGSSSFSSNIKDAVVCSPRRSGSMLLVQRCYGDEVRAIKSVLESK